ncbi:MAG TPA: hypothetical protein VK886_01660 [Vicinamibacterales bacterium]|nr:hypothetical protein [Vicinamibacterales bacterium]
MRPFLLVVAVALGAYVGIAALPPAGIASAHALEESVAGAQQQPSGRAQVDINVNRGGGGAWWASPVWIAIGIIGLVLLIVVIAMAARGGGTTVIKE